ncbi:acyltransferase family protein [Streptomyces candidus]|uniref:Mycarose O-acyltransferase n=1 Tax=Streptomyces candidus TaxID=67283 RepID=A0A7X0LPM3_9ACTN|nr:acyltransferase [Streptomyces candidus]MBB6436678.1 mycarose O-acyltransferase [Streptomyces candidus]GHH51030.1 acyltransferase [Streptomyces candidus]
MPGAPVPAPPAEPAATPPGPTDRRSTLPSLTGLRFVAAFIVLISHTGYLFYMGAAPEDNHSDYLFVAGSVGLTFFFVLSGFILTWVARDSDTRRRFWRRRLVKIFPNHLVTLAATVVLMITGGVAVTVSNTLPSVFLLQSWIPSQEVIQGHGTNSPSWSLTCELLFYLSFPFVLPLVRRIRDNRLWLWTGGVTLAVLTLPFVAQVLPDQPVMWWGGGMSWWEYWFVYHFPLSRMLEFVLGILVAQIVLKGRWIGMRTGWAALLAVAGYAVTTQLPDVFAWMSLTALPLALLIAAAATADVRGSRTGFGGRTMVWLGEISFALYMVHYLVLYYGPVRAVSPDHGMQTWTFLEALRDIGLTMAISLVLAWLLHRYVEEPAMRRWARPASVPPKPTAEQQRPADRVTVTK